MKSKDGEDSIPICGQGVSIPQTREKTGEGRDTAQAGGMNAPVSERARISILHLLRTVVRARVQQRISLQPIDEYSCALNLLREAVQFEPLTDATTLAMFTMAIFEVIIFCLLPEL